MTRDAHGLAVVLVLALAPAATCGGKGGSPAPPPGTSVTSVMITPATAVVTVGTTLQLSADVTATGAVDTTVSWKVDGVAGGNATVGTVSDAGLYVTPYPAPASVTVTATSRADATKSGSAALTIVPPPAVPGPGLAVDAQAARHAISPLIYGMNQYSLNFSSLARQLRVPLERWGGDATTRYNWTLDVTNAANDWYFTTDPNANTDYPDSSEFNDMVARDRAAGTLSMGTIPMIGWTTRRERACGFSVAKYGPQQQVNPYNSDCGNGIRPDGSNIIADPTDTSVAIGPDFARAWVTYLVDRFGDARHGGVAIYSLDNEPELWQFVHRDVHPEYPGYDDLAGLGLTYAAAIKLADPSALVSGPVTAGWMGYFYSPKDWRSGWSTGPDYVYWGNPVDRQAHGDVPFIEWYLRQFAAAERAAGHRLLDILDVHGYVISSDVQFQPAGDTALQHERLESVRAFWDRGYRVQGDINDAPYLIPRMRGWVTRNYPGTLTAITEYNLGALDHINGALAQADLLGVFGRQGLDVATLWAPPAPGTPGFYAFKLFRNYDGSGGAFGDTGVSATSADQSHISVYAAERSTDHALTILAINKTFADLTCTIAIAGFDGASQARVYQLSAGASGIVHRPNLPLGARSLESALPAASVTLFVIDER